MRKPNALAKRYFHADHFSSTNIVTNALAQSFTFLTAIRMEALNPHQR
jgi:hypothetical protein